MSVLLRISRKIVDIEASQSELIKFDSFFKFYFFINLIESAECKNLKEDITFQMKRGCSSIEKVMQKIAITNM